MQAFEQALAEGRWRSAILAALSELDRRPADNFIAGLRLVAEACPRGLLGIDEPLVAELESLYTRAGCSAFTRDLITLAAPPRGSDNRAAPFMLVNEATQLAAPFELRARHAEDQPTVGARRLDHTTASPGTLQACARAAEWVRQRLDPGLDPELYHWEIAPGWQGMPVVHGESLGAAALVSLVARLRSYPINPRLAFSGRFTGGQLELRPANARFRSAKAQAIGEWPELQTLVFPGGPTPEPNGSVAGAVSPASAGAVEAVSDAFALLSRAFGRDVRQDGQRLRPGLRPLTEAVASSPAAEETLLCLRAVMLAACEPLPVPVIEAALIAMPRVDLTGFSVGSTLRRWKSPDADPLVTTSYDDQTRFYLAAGEGESRDDALIAVAGQRWVGAHLALAAALAEAAEERSWTASIAAHHALAGADEEAERQVRHIAREPGPGRLELLLRVAELLTPWRGRAAAWSIIERALSGVDDGEDHLWELRSAHIAVLAMQLPTPVAMASRHLDGPLTVADRLLALQAVTECLLHLVATAGVALYREGYLEGGRPQLDVELGKLAERPSIGTLVDAIVEVFGHGRVTGEAALFGRRIRGWLNGDKGGALLAELPTRFNATLHGLAAWPAFFLGDKASGTHVARRQTANKEAVPVLADRVLTLLTGWRDLLDGVVLVAKHPTDQVGQLGLVGPDPGRGEGRSLYALRVQGSDGAAVSLDLGDLVARLDVPRADNAGDVGFYRGFVGTVVRYWSFAHRYSLRRELRAVPERPLDLFGPGDEGLAAAHPPRLAWLAETYKPLGKRVAQLAPARHPWPLANAVVGVNRAVNAADPSALLAYLDLAMSTLLRLACFPVVYASDPESSAASGYLDRWRRHRPTKSRLLRELCREVDASPTSATWGFDGWVRNANVRSVAWSLVDWLQRFEHLPGQIADYGEALVRIADELGWLLARTPWAAQKLAWRFVASTGEGTGIELMGVPDPRKLCRTDDAFGLSPGEAAFILRRNTDAAHPPHLLRCGSTVRLAETTEGQAPRLEVMDTLERRKRLWEPSYYSLGLGGRVSIGNPA